MRLTRASCLAAVMALAGACAHNDVVDVISRDGSNSIPSIGLTPGAAGVPTGTRAINRFISAGPFDTSVADAFARSTTNPANAMTDFFGLCYNKTNLLVYEPGANVSTFTATPLYLPGLNPYNAQLDNAGCGGATGYIVPAANGSNGANVWEFWHDWVTPVDGVRYVQGLVRYAVNVRGALDASEYMLTGSVAAPDSLVFMAGDFNPGGKKGDAVYTSSCANAGVIHLAPFINANPLLLAAGTSAGGSADIDQTVCAIGTGADTVWSKGFGTTTSPVPANNNNKLNKRQYNFLVIWETLPDSTPDYSKPVFRAQIGPLVDVNGNVINNGYGPLPKAQLTPLQLGGLKGATSRPDTLRLTFNTLAPLATGAYQVWLLRTDSAKSQLVTGRIVRLKDGVAVDTLNNVSEFNTGATTNGARAEFDVGNFPQGFWNAATLAVAGSTGNTTLPAAQPLWTIAVAKPSGVAANLTGPLAFGSFNSGTGTLLFGAAGSGTGGVFGKELREDLVRLQRPPKGYVYLAWLVNSSDTTKHLSLGGLLTPYPQLQSLDDADTRQTEPLSGVEITDAAVRFVAPAITAFCGYDRMQIRLAPRNNNGTLPPTTVLSQSSPNKNMGITGCP